MDLVLVFLLILAFLSTGYTTLTSGLCYKICPRGYYKVGDCNSPTAGNMCEKCGNDTFTAKENAVRKCIRCNTCSHRYETEIKPCSFVSDVVCACNEGFYNAGSYPDKLDCMPCPCKSCKEHDNRGKCQNCKSCMNNPECKRKCIPAPAPLNATPSMTTRNPAANGTSNPVTHPVQNNLNRIPWLLLVGVLVAFLVVFWLLLLFTRNPIRFPDSCPCWSVTTHLELPVEDTKVNEQCNHQGGSPTTLTFHISEETPMMNLSQSPATPDQPAHISPLSPDTERKAARQAEQSEQWPAIVLYAIIKEVPLRRWKEFLRLLSLADQQLERVELEAGLGLGSIERQYQMLRLWSQRSSASLSDVFSALHYMDLSGCAQLLQESLEKLQWRPELKQGLTDHDISGAMQDI